MSDIESRPPIAIDGDALSFSPAPFQLADPLCRGPIKCVFIVSALEINASKIDNARNEYNGCNAMTSASLSTNATERECKLAIAEPDSTISLTWAKRPERITRELRSRSFHCVALAPRHAMEGKLDDKLHVFDEYVVKHFGYAASSKKTPHRMYYLVVSLHANSQRSWQRHRTKTEFVTFMTRMSRRCLAQSATGEPVTIGVSIPVDYPQGSPKVQEMLEAVGELFEAPSQLPVHFPKILHTRLAEARMEFQRRHKMLSSADVGKLSHYASGSNAAAPAYRMQSRGEVFSVPVGGKMGFPDFQFDASSGRPLPVIAELLKVWPKRTDWWSLALWLDAPNPYLEHKRPVELLVSQAATVIEAAKAQASIEQF